MYSKIWSHEGPYRDHCFVHYCLKIKVDVQISHQCHYCLGWSGPGRAGLRSNRHFCLLQLEFFYWAQINETVNEVDTQSIAFCCCRLLYYIYSVVCPSLCPRHLPIARGGEILAARGSSEGAVARCSVENTSAFYL